MMLILLMYVIPIMAYLIIAGIALDIRLYECHIGVSGKPYESIRKPEPIDVWIALFWPIWFIFFIMKLILLITHTMIGYGLFMFGIRYIETTRYQRINDSLE